ncbi:hypothetical protein AMTR_s00002p00241080 [Amborella trichopoda]|uniref:Uncharacterized protein n=1 Tax=Amborella trichopoda TaxID=13333 RepID=W1NZY3_AMBTC|nr:hypothetical protein AMTR_s00002p00241080 [Amborella trichopoda]
MKAPSFDTCSSKEPSRGSASKRHGSKGMHHTQEISFDTPNPFQALNRWQVDETSYVDRLVVNRVVDLKRVSQGPPVGFASNAPACGKEVSSDGILGRY